MAEEKVITSAEASPIAAPAAAADGHKRKLEDMELNNASETLTDSQSKLDPDSLNNADHDEENGGADESDAKRPRLESNGDNVSEPDAHALVPQNGHQEGGKEDEPKDEDSKQPESAADSAQPAEGQEPREEPSENINEEPASGENEKTQIGTTDDLEQPKAEVEAPSKELPREGDDVPVPSDERQPGSDTQILSRKMEVPNDKVGVLIGKAGDTIRSLQDNSGAKIQIMRDADADPRSATRPLEIVGTLENINKAEKLIKDHCAAASGGEQLEIQVPIEKVGLIIGKGGETIRNLQTRSGARIQLIQQNLSDGDQSRERTVRVTGNKKQIETAREMIKDVMNQTMRPSPLSVDTTSRLSPTWPVAPQWGPRGPHHAQFSGYDYPQRGPYPSQNSQYPPPSYGNYPPSQAPRSNYGPSWEQRPPASMHGPSPQGNYNYGQQQGPDYGHPPYSQTPAQPFGHGYNEAKYDHHASSQHFGHMGSQPTPYAQGGTHSGYGPQDQYGKPPMYGMQPQVPHSQPYGQPRPNQPGEVPYQGPGSSAQPYGQNMPLQQSYPYASSGPMQQSYPLYGSAPATDGYGHTPATASASGYPPQGGQPVAGYGQPGAQQPPAYPQTGPAGGYGSYPTAQHGYTEQPATTMLHMVSRSCRSSLRCSPRSCCLSCDCCWALVMPNHLKLSLAMISPAVMETYPHQLGGKSVSPQAAYAQYDSSQMYGAHR
ncbi:UNVERIFIED_CONTAM: Far upstream element-binding protein 2 [Sesamum radiatum]|uniref:Far upstream element-binding protein 2 n=1 Tax=Sesamum radiatum TaxID=300843 RepID=A0AAW2PX44_SESRA